MTEYLSRQPNFEDLGEARKTGIEALEEQGRLEAALRALEAQRQFYNGVLKDQVPSINSYYEVAKVSAEEASNNRQ